MWTLTLLSNVFTVFYNRTFENAHKNLLHSDTFLEFIFYTQLVFQSQFSWCNRSTLTYQALITMVTTLRSIGNNLFIKRLDHYGNSTIVLPFNFVNQHEHLIHVKKRKSKQESWGTETETRHLSAKRTTAYNDRRTGVWIIEWSFSMKRQKTNKAAVSLNLFPFSFSALPGTTTPVLHFPLYVIKWASVSYIKQNLNNIYPV